MGNDTDPADAVVLAIANATLQSATRHPKFMAYRKRPMPINTARCYKFPPCPLSPFGHRDWGGRSFQLRAGLSRQPLFVVGHVIEGFFLPK